MHIRRGDFQYHETRVSAQEILNTVKHLLDTNVTRILYIATDEKDKNFFLPFRQHFQVRFLSDFVLKAHLGDDHLNQNHVGMVEQVICANAHTFIGTPLSTFTGYITRMRG
jgi:GDP-fucose protein O-fucosyltransferase